MKDMEKKIKDSNVLIAEFMGREIRTDGISWFDEKYKTLKYNDWNALIPVVEKIEKLPFIVTIEGSSCVIMGQDCDLEIEVCKGKLKSTYEAVLEFSKWYNEQK